MTTPRSSAKENVAIHDLLNTLYIQAQGAYLHVDHETLVVEVDGKEQLQVPVHHIGAIVCFGNILVSPVTIHRAAEDGRTIVFMDSGGRFKARMVGPTSGNVLLRQAQYAALGSPEIPLNVARNIVAGKIKNSRQVLLRQARQTEDAEASAELSGAAEAMANALADLEKARELDTVRGREGEASLAYFGVFRHLVMNDPDTFRWDGRTRRPPRDPINALLSFLYAMLTTDCVGAAEGVGLDPQVGYLHAVRPGRPALALDLVEELRAAVADRLALTLINRRQLTKEHFTQHPGGAVTLNDEGRKAVVIAYQRRKQEEVRHPLLDRAIPVGLISHVQARLLARHLRGDLEHYVPFVNPG